MDLLEAAATLQAFSGWELGSRIGALERAIELASSDEVVGLLQRERIASATLHAALQIKALAGQVNVVIHGLGILLALPTILEADELVKHVSLGAGTTKTRRFDLETDRRVAEFKFISWRGGSEAIRQNQLFKDFYNLAEYETPKKKELYVTGAQYPRKFFAGGRAVRSVLSRNNKLWNQFQAQYGREFSIVSDYYSSRLDQVKLIDLAELLPELFGTQLAAEALDQEPVSG